MKLNQKSFLLLLLVTIIVSLSGCIKKYHFVTVGDVPAVRSLELIGSTVKQKLSLYVNEIGETRIVGGKGKADMISATFPEYKIKTLVSMLEKAINWGEISKKEKVEIKKEIDNIHTSEGLLSVSFIATRDDWHIDLCLYYVDKARVLRGYGPDNSRNIHFYLGENQVSNLIEQLKIKVPEMKLKAKNVEKKDALFK